MTTRLARIKRVLTTDANEAVEPPVHRLVRLFRRYPWQMHALGLGVNVAIGVGVWLAAGPKFLAGAWALIGIWILLVVGAESLRTRLRRNL